MRYQLVAASVQDKEWLEQLRRAVYRDLFFATWGAWDEARHLRHCEECWNLGSIYLVETGETRVGMIQLFELPDAVEVGEIQIAPTYQNKGIGTRILQDTIARAHAERKKVSLSTGLKNHRAFELYMRLGFRHAGQTDTHNLLEFLTA
jgi:ribosomal protein S18 acetylase RimI-like enzyme